MTSVCLDFHRYTDNTTWGQTFTLGVLRFTGLGAIAPFVNLSDKLIGLQFSDQGIQIDLPESVDWVSLQIASTIRDAPVKVTVLDAHGQVIDSVVVPYDKKVRAVTLTAPGIAAIVIIGGGGESLLVEICVPSALLERVVDEALDPGRITDPELRDILSDPGAKRVLDKIRDDIMSRINGDSSGIGILPITWDPQLLCILANLALVAGATFIVAKIATTIGVATLGALAEKDALALLMTTFGISANVAKAVYWIFVGGAAIAYAESLCSDEASHDGRERFEPLAK